MLATSCSDIRANNPAKSAHSRASARAMTKPGLLRRRVSIRNVYLKPIAQPHDALLVRIVAVEAIVLLGAEMVVGGPDQRPAAQALSVEIKRGHRRVDLFGVGRPAGLGENLLQYAAGNPTFGDIGRREGIFAVRRRLAA